MKLITENAVYVQRYDLGQLFITNSSDSMFKQIFGNSVLIIDDSSKYQFEKFEKADEMEYFKSLDWIINYDDFKDLSDEEIITIGKSIEATRNQIAQNFNAMQKEERKNNSSMITKCQLLDFKMDSLSDILWFKKGHIQMTLPEEYLHPERIKKDNSLVHKLKKTLVSKKN